jgi:hypothetical protein
MTSKVTCVIQGPLYPETPHVVQNYLDSGLFADVIYSGRTDQASLANMLPSKVRKVFSDPPENCGVGNRNIQITSTRAGLAFVNTKYAWKVRGDQILPVDTIHKVNNFVREHSHRLEYINDIACKTCKGQIFVAGNYRMFPFHPRDHIFIGYASDIRGLFDIPLDSVSQNADYSRYLRAEAWIGANFLAKKWPSVNLMLRRYDEFLVDNAPKIDYAIRVSNDLTFNTFKALPRIEFSWPKHGLRQYHYHVGESLSEFWDD